MRLFDSFVPLRLAEGNTFQTFRFSSRLLVTTLTLLMAMAAPAIRRDAALRVRAWNMSGSISSCARMSKPEAIGIRGWKDIKRGG